MTRSMTIIASALILSLAATGGSAEERKNPVILMSTSLGDIKIELDEAKAPITVKNFLAYVNSKFYDGTIFHRVIPGFMIQGGGLDKDMKQKPTNASIKNESGNGLTNMTGTIAMARTNDPDSATAQFFINVSDNANLDRPPGYAVFGKVVQGLDVVQKIEHVATSTKMQHQNVPADPVIIKSVTVVK